MRGVPLGIALRPVATPASTVDRPRLNIIRSKIARIVIGPLNAAGMSATGIVSLSYRGAQSPLMHVFQTTAPVLHRLALPFLIIEVVG